MSYELHTGFGLTQFLPMILLIVVAAAVSISILLLLSRKLSKSRLPTPIRQSLVPVLKVPIVVAVSAYGFLLSVQYIDSVSPALLPYYAKPVELTLLVELVVVATAIRAAGEFVKRLTVSVAEVREAERFLVYGVYTLGLIALAYVVLSSPLAPTAAPAVWATVNFMTGLIITYLTTYIANIVLRRYALGIGGKEPRLQTTITFVRRLILAAIALIGVSAATFTSFPAAGGLIASLFIAAGFSSIVVGLAAQSSLSNLVAGMLVSVAQPFKIGDAVVFKNEFCFVEDIRLVLTVLRTWDNRRLMVPNQLFLSEVVTNYTAEDPTMLAPVLVQITYESDLDKAMKIMKDLARKHPDCLPIGDLPNVAVMDYTESGISLRLLSRAKDQPTAFNMERDLLYQIRKAFEANGIEIAYPRRRIVLRDETHRSSKRARAKHVIRRK
jgi:small conductance mechanosensitive channel